MTDTNQTNPFDDKDTIKVMIGEPSGGLIDVIAHDNRLDFVMELARLETRRPFKFFTGNVGRTPINYARQMMAEEAMKQNMDYLFMLDDDMIVPRRCFERTFDALISQKADISAPMCTQRIHPYHPVLYKHNYVPANDPLTPEKMNLKNDFIEDYEPNSIVKVDGIGFGVVLISVPFLRKMNEKMPHGMFFSNTNVGEDIWFCINARRFFDAKIVVDTSIKVGHLKHPEIATELDYVVATKQQDKFMKVYGPDAPKGTYVWSEK